MVRPTGPEGTDTLRYAAPVPGPSSRELLSAEILSIGSELTVGETRDTNAGELARSLTEAGVHVQRLQALPDDLDATIDAFRTALDRADLAVSTGGLGPTPDDLTREAIAAACGETPTVDPDIEAWLRGLWTRRGLPFSAINLKQAWRIQSATAIPNENGTAPGWWVDRPDGRVVVALPGPPREMRPMWRDWVVPRLRTRGLGAEVAQTTYRLAGIGESVVADLLGEEILRSTNPIVATYARQDAVDVRVSARAGGDRSAAELVASASAIVRERLGDHVWATGETSWGEAIAARLDELGWSLATLEVGTGGALAHLLGSVPRLLSAEVRRGDGAASSAQGNSRTEGSLAARAAALRRSSGADVAVAVRARPRAGDTAVGVVVVTPAGTHRESRLAFLSGEQGRHRAALAAADVLLRRLRG
jgi:nicotinamide-nucleotide amidase